MQDKIYEAIEYWAGFPSWYINNPKDTKRFDAAIVKLYIEVGSNINREDIRQVLKKYSEKTPAFWANPSDKKIEEYVEKILLVIKKLQKEGRLN